MKTSLNSASFGLAERSNSNNFVGTVVMNTEYTRIATAINFISDNVNRQPSLDEIAAHVHMSPFHFQRMFTEWAGVSPKKFLQYLTLEYAKRVLGSEKQPSLFDAAEQTGLSGTGRLHDLFVNIEAMTPGEYRNGGKGLEIHYSFGRCRFGNYIVASTNKGICNLEFFDGNAETALRNVIQQWSNARILEKQEDSHQHITSFFNHTLGGDSKFSLHLRGTPFQLKVWQALLKIPEGALRSYGHLAGSIGQPSASRAVGSAIGSNQVAFIIPCHRVIRNAGVIGAFRWGSERKKAMIAWEAAQLAEAASSVY